MLWNPQELYKRNHFKINRIKKIVSNIEHKTTCDDHEVWDQKWRNIPLEGYFRSSERALPTLTSNYEKYRNVGDKL